MHTVHLDGPRQLLLREAACDPQLPDALPRRTNSPARCARKAQDGHDLLPAMAMIDAFYVHLRLIAEFLTRRTSDLDFGPRDLGVDDWTTPATEAAGGLVEYWDRASKYVVHFGHSRVPENLDELQAFEVSGAALKAMATDAFDVLEMFIARVEANAADGAGVTVARLRAQTMRDELNRSVRLLGEA